MNAGRYSLSDTEARAVKSAPNHNNQSENERILTEILYFEVEACIL